MKKSKRKAPETGPEDNTRVNGQIKSSELRVISDDEGNHGILSTRDALSLARGKGLDLIEISPKAKPPVAKITDFGKWLYNEKKKIKASKAKAQSVEVKSIQIKIGTGQNDKDLKAKTATKWLEEGHRIKVELFLPGRSKYLERKFLEERINNFLSLIKVEYKVAQELKKTPKGLTMIIERGRQ